MKRVLTRGALALLLCCAQIYPTSAQSSSPFGMLTVGIRQQYRLATLRTMQMLLGKYEKLLAGRNREIAEDIRRYGLVVSLDDNVYGVYADYRNQRREIHVSVGFILAMEDVLDAAVLAENFNVGSTKDVTKYFSYIADTINANAEAMIRGGPVRPGEPYAQWLGLSNSEVREIYSRQDFEQERIWTKTTLLAMVVGHELGHHVLGHLEPQHIAQMASLSPSQWAEASRKQEVAADIFALHLATRAGYPPFGAALAFVLFAAVEGPPGGQPLTLHPPSVCRAAITMKDAALSSLQNREFVEALRAKHEYERFHELITSLDRSETSLAAKCPDLRTQMESMP